MRGDFTRLTFRPDKHYRGVRLQQGRVGLDADWNEQVDIDAHHRETGVGDLVGPTGAPHHPPAEFRHFQVRAAGTDLAIAPGRLYVDGILCENEAVASASAQPHLPLAAPIVRYPDGAVQPLPATPGTYLVYLDVWQREITPLEDPAIREDALGGPDTAIRAQTVWQVGLLQVAEPAPTCLSELAAWNDLRGGSSGRLSARAQPGETSNDPCIVPPGGGYRRLENQLYRVEIHTAGGPGTATFKWSRENGSIVTRWLRKDGNDLTVESAGRDAALGFAAGDWVELTDDDRELRGEAGMLVRLANVEGRVLTIAADSPPMTFEQFGANPKVRRWDLPVSGEMTVERPATNDGYLALEDGVEVRFAPPSGNGAVVEVYRTGDYWLIPARTLRADVEWPRPGGLPAALPPQGVRHHFSRLAIVRAEADSTFAVLSDCRPLFPAVTELTNFFYVGGDGQEGLPGALLRQPLQVGVANGRWPVAGARVHFQVTQGGGGFEPATPARPQEAVVTTDATGVAGCRWRIDQTSDHQQVTATLLDDLGGTVHLPIRFAANLSVAREVGYAAGGICTQLAGTTTVQQAIDELCRNGSNVDGIHVKEVLLINPETALPNDGLIPAPLLASGLAVACDRSIAPEIKTKPVCTVAIDLPFPFNEADRALWGDEVIGFQSIVLAAVVSAQENRIVWEPTKATATWLSDRLFATLLVAERTDPVLARLTLPGNFIWSTEDRALYLDGESFGLPTGSTIGLDLPSGDGRRGGDFAMWFWLVPEVAGLRGLTISVATVTGGQAATGAVVLSSRAQSGQGTTVSLTSDNPAVTVPATVTIPTGEFTASFPITTQPVATDRTVTITGHLADSADQSATLVVRAPRLQSLTLAAAITGSQSVGGTVTLDGAAPAGGIAVALTSGNPAVATVPATVTVAANQTAASITVTAQGPGQTTIAGTLLDSTRSATLGVLPKLQSLVLAAVGVVRGKPLAGTVTLTQTVPFPVTVTLSSDNPAVAQVAGSLTIDAGKQTGSFSVATPGPAGLAKISAALPGATTQSDQMNVYPRLQSFTIQPNSVDGGVATTGTVVLESAAPFAVAISLTSSSSAAAAPPASVAVAATKTSVAFTISTGAVSANRNVNITAFYGDVPAPPVTGESQLVAALTVRRGTKDDKEFAKEKEFFKEITKDKEFEKKNEQEFILVDPGPIAGPITGPINFAAPAAPAAAETAPPAGRAFIRERPAVGPPPEEPPAAAEAPGAAERPAEPAASEPPAPVDQPTAAGEETGARRRRRSPRRDR